MDNLDTETLAPLLDASAEQPDSTVRIAALEAASHFPLEPGGWQDVANRTYRVVREEAAGSDARRAALQLAVKIPLLSLRKHLRRLAEDPAETDRDLVAETLDDVRDPARLDNALVRAGEGDAGAFRILASMPLEDLGINPAEIPPLPATPPSNAELWRAFALARVGDYGAIDAVLEGATPEPEMFWGSPWAAYSEIATVRPIPQALREHLLAAVQDCDGCPNERMIQLLTWAATGVADAEGTPIELEGQDFREPRPGTTSPNRGLYIEVAADEPRPEPDLASQIIDTISEANRRAAALAPDAWPNVEIGNKIIQSLPVSVQPDTWPVAELALLQLKAERPALDDEQMAWVLARDEPARIIREISRLLARMENDGQRCRLLRLLSLVADHLTGRTGSAFRGANGIGIGTPYGRAPLIDDEPREAAIGPEPQSPGDKSVEPESVQEEERRVHARILHDGQERNSFVSGAENLVRCWIGLPEGDAAMADRPIPRIDLPPEGLLLMAVLSWGDQTDRKPLILPAARNARSGDCDLRIRVPEDEPFVSADIAFLYRGRVFEVVQVQALAVPPDAAEPPGQQIRVRVQVSRREVIDLPERAAFDATILWGGDEADAGQMPDTPAASPCLRVFGDQGAGLYDLQDTETAITWINKNLFAAEKSLVRRRAALSDADRRPMLDADDPEVQRLLRDMARHGAALFNELAAQGFDDPGMRIQLLNRDARAYVPLEFVYDQGYPADDAALCSGWEEALLSDADICPVCGGTKLTPEQRAWAPTICPLGFWSLQKIIERLDSTSDGQVAAPSIERRALPAITGGLFASSDKVSPEGRASVWRTLTQHLEAPEQAKDWEQWKQALHRHPQLLLVLPHHDLAAALDYLEIGSDQLPPRMRRLSRGQLDKEYVNPDCVEPGPIVLLLGCRTEAKTETGYTSLARLFQQLRSSIVVGTLAQILGRHAAPVASELVSQLLAVDDPDTDFGAIMRRVRRRMLANGYLMSLCLVALGDAEWRLTPRQRQAVVAGEPTHVSP